MKKLISIIILGLIWFNSSYAETVNLNCKYLSGNLAKFYVGLDFEKSLFINKYGVDWDMVYNDNVIQSAMEAVKGGKYTHFLMTISRLSGSGSAKGFKLTEAELDKLAQKNLDEIFLNGIGNLEDKSLDAKRNKIITLNLIDYLNSYKKTMYGHDIPPSNTEFECEKSEKKF